MVPLRELVRGEQKMRFREVTNTCVLETRKTAKVGEL